MTRIILPITLLLAVGLAACGRAPMPALTYYILEPIGTSAGDAADTTVARSTEVMRDATCEIMPVNVHPAFASDRIALRTRSHEINYYSHHKWASSPSTMFTEQIEAYLDRRRIFAAAGQRMWGVVPDYQLDTEIHRVEVIEREDGLAAHVKVEFMLIERSSGAIVLTHAADREESLPQRDLNLYASTVSRIFLEELDSFSVMMVALDREANEPR